MINKIIISILIGYIFGLFQTSFFLSKIYKKDIRKSGSKNLGATNALRILGKKAGAITFFLDALKGFLACLLISIIFNNSLENIIAYQTYALLGSILGHCFPIYLKFKGGKGVSSFVGSMLFIQPLAAIFGLIVFVTVSKFSRQVSIGSLIMTFFFMTYLAISSAYGIEWTSYIAAQYTLIGITISYLVIVFRHKENILRIAKKQERKI